jgi:predicted DNA-binding transcriptional regulator YafY
MSELRQLLFQHPKGVTIAEIAAHLDVTQRSARRYLRELSMDLQAVPERPGGQKRWRIPAVDLPRRVAMRRTQAYALLAARELFRPMRGSALYEEIDLATQTLLGVARRPGRGPNAGLTEESELERRFRYLPFAPKDYAQRAEDLDNLFLAVADLRPVSCRYPRPSDGQLMRARIHPYALLLYKDAIWCLALDTASGVVAALALDGVERTRCHEDERFAIPADFDVDDYVQGQFGLWRQVGEPHEVIIDVAASASEVVRTRRVHSSQQLEPLPDGGVRLRVWLSDLSEVATWVLGFGSLAAVVAPFELRERVRDELGRALDRYASLPRGGCE